MIVVGFVLAAALGGLIRWRMSALNRPGFPLGTLGVNIAAAFCAGLASTVSTTAALILTTALLGAMSTFSTVMGELVELREDRGSLRAASYGVITVVAGVTAAWIGLSVAG